MSKNVKLLLAGCIAGLSLLPLPLLAAGNSDTKYQVDAILATVNGKPITRDELFTALIAFYPDQTQDTLNRLVNMILIYDKAGQEKVSVAEAELFARARELGVTGEISPLIRQSVETSLLVEKMLVAEKKLTVSKKEITEFFERHKNDFKEPEKFHVRVLLAKDEDDAKSILLALRVGADFAKMAEVKSHDAATKKKGGDLGFISRGTLAPEAERIIFSLKENEISDPVRTAQGFFLFKVEAITPEKEASLADEAVGEKIRKIILSGKVQRELPEWIANLRKSATIK